MLNAVEYLKFRFLLLWGKIFKLNKNKPNKKNPKKKQKQKTKFKKRKPKD
jgi:hypothetical protein